MNSYIIPAPVFADAGHKADVIGHAKTEAEAVALYRDHFAGTGSAEVAGAKKIVTSHGNVDGWAPVLAG